jgi:hypothetical protein
MLMIQRFFWSHTNIARRCWTLSRATYCPQSSAQPSGIGISGHDLGGGGMQTQSGPAKRGATQGKGHRKAANALFAAENRPD